ncbi:hypothetical protein GDO81_005248 [Engystomops pustulosus]|uniref:Epithelial-stromal interaction protein 1 n=1 Tax=Engystomops pustulosus TaxID=76066 RepID=A0AAV7CNU7_ENGPU|nr:hypothetical protein GDO81_005248 [Engystomops pustulosus]
MYGQSSYSRSGNGSRMQNRYQTQRNYNHSENISNRMEEQQNSDPQQDYVNEQPAPRPPQAPQDSQFSCQVIQPDPVKREKLLTMRRKEEEDYESFKNSRRSGPIHLTPKKLGGETSELEVREQQQQIQAQSKYQKMMKREEYKKKLKEEEEAKIQKMKDLQRQKAEKLQQKRQQQDLEREQRWHEDRWRRNNTFLDQFDSESHHYDRRFGQPSEWVRFIPAKNNFSNIKVVETHRQWNSLCLQHFTVTI